MTDPQPQNALMPMDGFSDSDPTSSPLRGPGVRFKDDAYYSFSDKLDVKGKTYAVVDYKRGWQKLEKDCPPAYLMRELGKPMPPQPVVPKDQWKLNLNGQLEHPWKATDYLVLLDTETGEVSTFWSNTVGGRIAIGALKDQIAFMRQHRPDAIPIIELQGMPMPTQYGGTKPRPHFKICGWRGSANQQQMLVDKTAVEELETVEAPSLAETLDDEIPDFGPELPEIKKAPVLGKNMKVSDADLAAFMAAAKEKTKLKLGHEVGQKYARVFVRDSQGDGDDSKRTVFCFVDLTNGNVLRSDSWKRPNLKVKNSIQGNIYDEHKGSGSMHAGVNYLGKYLGR